MMNICNSHALSVSFAVQIVSGANLNSITIVPLCINVNITGIHLLIGEQLILIFAVTCCRSVNLFSTNYWTSELRHLHIRMAAARWYSFDCCAFSARWPLALCTSLAVLVPPHDFRFESLAMQCCDIVPLCKVLNHTCILLTPGESGYMAEQRRLVCEVSSVPKNSSRAVYAPNGVQMALYGRV